MQAKYQSLLKEQGILHDTKKKLQSQLKQSQTQMKDLIKDKERSIKILFHTIIDYFWEIYQANLATPLYMM